MITWERGLSNFWIMAGDCQGDGIQVAIGSIFYSVNDTMGEKYRPNVAAILVNPSGQILVAERLSIPNSWQFPQGGVDKGESLKDALMREVEEELSIPPSSYQVTEERGGYRYDFPADFERWKNFKGQEQTYFRCDFTGDDSVINLDTAHPEFKDWRWIMPQEFDLGWVVEFKRGVYVRVLKDFFGFR
jgi:putative (di)nucleoside polyphosphate hydrolase